MLHDLTIAADGVSCVDVESQSKETEVTVNPWCELIVFASVVIDSCMTVGRLFLISKSNDFGLCSICFNARCINA